MLISGGFFNTRKILELRDYFWYRIIIEINRWFYREDIMFQEMSASFEVIAALFTALFMARLVLVNLFTQNEEGECSYSIKRSLLNQHVATR